jgi:hypothetical protein
MTSDEIARVEELIAENNRLRREIEFVKLRESILTQHIEHWQAEDARKAARRKARKQQEQNSR